MRRFNAIKAQTWLTNLRQGQIGGAPAARSACRCQSIVRWDETAVQECVAQPAKAQTARPHLVVAAAKVLDQLSQNLRKALNPEDKQGLKPALSPFLTRSMAEFSKIRQLIA
jgi:hypothetical protein